MPARDPVSSLGTPSILRPVARPRDAFVSPSAAGQGQYRTAPLRVSEALSGITEGLLDVFSDRIKARDEKARSRALAAVSDEQVARIAEEWDKQWAGLDDDKKPEFAAGFFDYLKDELDLDIKSPINQLLYAEKYGQKKAVGILTELDSQIRSPDFIDGQRGVGMFPNEVDTLINTALQQALADGFIANSPSARNAFEADWEPAVTRMRLDVQRLQDDAARKFTRAASIDTIVSGDASEGASTYGLVSLGAGATQEEADQAAVDVIAQVNKDELVPSKRPQLLMDALARRVDTQISLGNADGAQATLGRAVGALKFSNGTLLRDVGGQAGKDLRELRGRVRRAVDRDNARKHADFTQSERYFRSGLDVAASAGAAASAAEGGDVRQGARDAASAWLETAVTRDGDEDLSDDERIARAQLSKSMATLSDVVEERLFNEAVDRAEKGEYTKQQARNSYSQNRENEEVRDALRALVAGADANTVIDGIESPIARAAVRSVEEGVAPRTAYAAAAPVVTGFNKRVAGAHALLAGVPESQRTAFREALNSLAQDTHASFVTGGMFDPSNELAANTDLVEHYGPADKSLTLAINQIQEASAISNQSSLEVESRITVGDLQGARDLIDKNRTRMSSAAIRALHSKLLPLETTRSTVLVGHFQSAGGQVGQLSDLIFEGVPAAQRLTMLGPFEAEVNRRIKKKVDEDVAQGMSTTDLYESTTSRAYEAVVEIALEKRGVDVKLAPVSTAKLDRTLTEASSTAWESRGHEGAVAWAMQTVNTVDHLMGQTRSTHFSAGSQRLQELVQNGKGERVEVQRDALVGMSVGGTPEMQDAGMVLLASTGGISLEDIIAGSNQVSVTFSGRALESLTVLPWDLDSRWTGRKQVYDAFGSSLTQTRKDAIDEALGLGGPGRIEFEMVDGVQVSLRRLPGLSALYPLPGGALLGLRAVVGAEQIVEMTITSDAVSGFVAGSGRYVMSEKDALGRPGAESPTYTDADLPTSDEGRRNLTRFLGLEDDAKNAEIVNLLRQSQQASHRLQTVIDNH